LIFGLRPKILRSKQGGPIRKIENDHFCIKYPHPHQPPPKKEKKSNSRNFLSEAALGPWPQGTPNVKALKFLCFVFLGKKEALPKSKI
jgi:hypothetical protein